MEIIGKIIEAMPEVSGTSKAGNAWKKREYVLETMETYPRKIFFSFFGDRADLYILQPGQMVKLTFDIDSRKFNDRWFVTINGLKAEDPNAGMQPVGQPTQQAYGEGIPQQPYSQPQQPYNQPQQPYNQPAQQPYGQPTPPPPVPQGEPSDDLPF